MVVSHVFWSVESVESGKCVELSERGGGGWLGKKRGMGWSYPFAESICVKVVSIKNCCCSRCVMSSKETETARVCERGLDAVFFLYRCRSCTTLPHVSAQRCFIFHQILIVRPLSSPLKKHSIDIRRGRSIQGWSCQTHSYAHT